MGTLSAIFHSIAEEQPRQLSTISISRIAMSFHDIYIYIYMYVCVCTSLMTVSVPLLNYILEGRLPFLSPKCPFKSWLSPIFLVESPYITIFLG